MDYFESQAYIFTTLLTKDSLGCTKKDWFNTLDEFNTWDYDLDRVKKTHTTNGGIMIHNMGRGNITAMACHVEELMDKAIKKRERRYPNKNVKDYFIKLFKEWSKNKKVDPQLKYTYFKKLKEVLFGDG